MRAGKLRTRLMVQRLATPTLDAFGAPSQSWSTWAKTWAEIESLSGGESFPASSPEANATHLVTIRHLAGLTAKMRFTEGARTYEVLHVADPDRRTRMQKITVAEVAGV